MYFNSQACIEPKDDNCKLWRYMDISKFLDIIVNNRLIFTRADLFSDLFEGYVSQPTLNKLKAKCGSEKYDFKKCMTNIETNIKRGYISCWHKKECESEFMWKCYATSCDAIAIQTSYKSLKKACDEDKHTQIIFTEVSYIDYSTDEMDIELDVGRDDVGKLKNLKTPFFYKRREFEHESELRAIFYRINLDHEFDNGHILKGNTLTTQTGEVYPMGVRIQELNPTGLDEFPPVSYISMDPRSLIENIYISPLAPEWFQELVKSTLRALKLDDIPVIPSSLSVHPSNLL